MLYYLLAGIGGALAALPEGVLVALSRSLGWLIVSLPGKRRHVLRSNLHHAFPEKTEAWRRAIALESARRMVEMALFVWASPYFSEKRLRRQFTVHPDLQRLIREYQEKPGPHVMLSPHFSLMESHTILPMLVDGKFENIAAIFRPLALPALDRWVKQTRERWGLRLLSRKDGHYQAVDLLRRNGAVAMLFDQNAGDRGALTLFMGRVCSSTELGGLLTEKCHAAPVFIFAKRCGFMRAVIHGERLDVKPRAETVLFGANHWLENKLRESDDTCADWLWLHNRWRHQDEPAKRFRLESKHDLLVEQMAWLNLATLPRHTRFYVRMPNWLGDVVMALPLLRALRLSRPDAELTLLAQPAFAPLLERLGVGDRVVALPVQGAGYWQFFRRMRLEYPDTHALFTNSFRGDLEAWLAGAPQRFGIVRAGQWRPLLTHSWRPPGDADETQIHQTRYWEKFFRRFGLKGELDLAPIPWPGTPAPTGLVIGLICGTENFPEKRWPVERWRELIQAILAQRPDAKFLLFGTARDADIAAAVAEGFSPASVVNQAGKTNLLEFAEGLAGCAVVVCNDTGGMHLANLLGVPVVALYGPTNPLRTGPVFEAPRVIVQPEGCPAAGGAPLAGLPAARVLPALEPWLARVRG